MEQFDVVSGYILDVIVFIAYVFIFMALLALPVIGDFLIAALILMGIDVFVFDGISMIYKDAFVLCFGILFFSLVGGRIYLIKKIGDNKGVSE